MKKAIAAFMFIAIAGCMSMSAFAADITSTDDGSNSSTETVDVIVDGTEGIDTVYSVTVDWESLDFTYTYDESAAWDPSNHTYTEDSAGIWNKASANVKVTNHSNAAVGVTANIDTSTKNGVTAALSNATFDLITGEGLTYETADNDTVTVSVTGVPTVADNFTVGTVKVAISAKQ